MTSPNDYQVLARKWRPHRFQDLVGQEHVLRVLTSALDKQRLHHAYLFAGTRGVGKTTLARIFAKALNCEVAISSQPCDNCAACRAIDAGQFLDLYEIDAASRTKVEDTRDLLENIAYPPAQGRYKVYLIDEVHMLSGHSFNALLKTLEEPPAHVKFLFATTEPKRLPITVLSRCLQFHLKQISVEQITAQLEHICTSEQAGFELPALTKLAQAADGSMRDALSLLDQAIAFCPEKIKLDEVNNMLGYITQDEVIGLLQALAARDSAKLFSVLRDLQQRSPDYQQVLAELISILHQAALFQAVPKWQEASAEIQDLAQKLSAEELQLYYQIALLGRKDLPLAPTPLQGFEMLVLRLLAFRPAAAVFDFAPPSPAAQTKAPQAAAKVAAVAPAAIATTTAADKEGPLEWKDLLPKLGLTGLAYALAINCKMGKQGADKIELILAQSYKPMVNQRLLDRIEEALGQYYQKKLKLSLTMTEEEVYTPAKQFIEEQDSKRASVLEAFQQDPGVQKIQNLFNATLDSQSVEVGD